MAFVLTVASDVHCPSEGSVTPAGNPKLSVGGDAVTTPAGIKGRSVSGCKTPNSNSSTQCASVADATGAASKLKVGGTGVALSTLTGSTDGSVPGLAADAGQSKLEAV